MAYQPKSYRKFLAGSVSAALVATAIGPVAASAESASFSDVSADHWAHMYITELANEGIINGFPDGTFGPQVELTRGQAAKLFQRALNLEVPEDLTSFDDVAESTDEELKEAAAAVKAAGIFKGSNGVFGASDTLTRAQMASVLVRAFGLEANDEVEVTLTDLDLIDESHRENVAILFQNGVTTGKEDGTYDGSGSVPRANFAAFLYRSLNMEASAIAEVTVVDSTTIDVVFNSVLEEVNVEDFTFDNDLEVLEAEILVEEEAGEEEVEAAAEGMTTVRLTTSVQEAGVEYTLSYMGEAVDTLEGFTPVDPEVVGASALNLKQVEVVFNSADLLVADEVEDVDNYTFLDASDDEVEVQSVALDGNVAVVTFEDNVPNQAKLSLEIDDNVTGEEYTQEEIYFFDTVIPEAVGAEVVGSKAIKVMFSEPINQAETTDVRDAFSLDDGSQFVKSVEFNETETEAIVSFYSDLEEGTATLNVTNDLEDYAGYSVVPSAIELEVVEDTEAPTIVEVKNVSPRKATLVFNEVIEFTNGTNELTGTELEAIYHTNTSNHALTAEIKNGNEIHVTFAEDDSLPNGIAYLYVDGETVRDLWNNENEQTLRITADVEVDETAPTVDKIEAISQSSLKVTFSETLNDTAEVKGNYTLLNEDGDEEDIIDDVDFAEDEDGNDVTNVVIINLDDPIYGDYTLVVDDVEDEAGNAIDSSETTFTVEDETPPEFTNFEATLYDDGDDVETLVIDFGEGMATEGNYSVLDLSKYQFNGASLDKDGVKITAFDKDSKVKIEVKKSKAEIDFDTDSVDAAGDFTSWSLEIARVADAAGNKTAALSGDVGIAGAGSVGVYDYKATATNELVLTLDDLVSDFDADDFELYQGATQLTENEVIGASIDNSGSRSVITFKLADGTLNTNGTYNGSDELIEVRTIADATLIDTENGFGEKVEIVDADEEKASDAIVAVVEKTPTDKDDVTVTFTDLDGDGEIDEDEQATFKLNYSEDLDPASISKLTYAVEGFTVDTVALDAGDASVVVITADANDDNTEYDVDITQALDIADANDVVVESGTEYTVSSIVVDPIADLMVQIGNLDAASTQDELEDARAKFEALDPADQGSVTNEGDLQALEQALVDGVAAAILAHATTPNAVAGTIELPAVANGFTIAVDSTTAALVYSATGELLADGNSDVVFTVTHTASGKDANTGTITVAVDVQ
ncbi:S-layer homology domain-containing protein [Cytobacillus sp. IB215316]|uniref:S-layer homology domain-containing protein n=1 Tax=Cytobacillus sp. IB215316 TaxID=3097354 RepID=UPI002A0C0992|nr:S-layer homology domain-containing protein [Cytobacillus sp. IB215316]MDX8361146.1 S-layer homology domain-containing protein [Cytobacillus sp. IB215316]